MQAQLDDPEVAEWVLSQPSDDAPYRPAVAEFTPEVAALYEVVDHLSEVIKAVMVAGNRKPPTLRPLLRPVTGVDRARAQREKQAHLSLVDEVKQAQERWVANRSV